MLPNKKPRHNLRIIDHTPPKKEEQVQRRHRHQRRRMHRAACWPTCGREEVSRWEYAVRWCAAVVTIQKQNGFLNNVDGRYMTLLPTVYICAESVHGTPCGVPLCNNLREQQPASISWCAMQWRGVCWTPCKQDSFDQNCFWKKREIKSKTTQLHAGLQHKQGEGGTLIKWGGLDSSRSDHSMNVHRRCTHSDFIA